MNESPQPDQAARRQDGAGRDWPVKQHGVKIAGENPMIVLYAPGSDDLVAIASVWTSTWSEAGTGRVLVIWADPDATGLGHQAPVGMFADNPELARFVWANFYNDYTPIKNRGIEQAPIRAARFTELAAGKHLHRITCVAGSTTIELEWRDVLDVVHVVTYPTGYEVSVIAAPCAAATISVNGKQAVGDVHQPEGWFGSSAILAFAETWIALEESASE